MSEPTTATETSDRFELLEEELLRRFPMLCHTILRRQNSEAEADADAPAPDGSTAVLVPPPVLSASADAFTCVICLEVASPIVVSVCGAQCTYCRHCFDRYVETRPRAARNRCCVVCPDAPVSRGLLYEDIRATTPLFSRIHRSAEVACPKNGCDWKGRLDQYRRHGASCVRQTVLESLQEKLDKMQAELDQTRAERDQARTERDEAWAERSGLEIIADGQSLSTMSEEEETSSGEQNADGAAGVALPAPDEAASSGRLVNLAGSSNGSTSNAAAAPSVANASANTSASGAATGAGAAAMKCFNSIFARRSWDSVDRDEARRVIRDYIRRYDRHLSDEAIEEELLDQGSVNGYPQLLEELCRRFGLVLSDSGLNSLHRGAVGQINKQAGALLKKIRRSCRRSGDTFGERFQGIPEEEIRNLVEIVRYVQGAQEVDDDTVQTG